MNQKEWLNREFAARCQPLTRSWLPVQDEMRINMYNPNVTSFIKMCRLSLLNQEIKWLFYENVFLRVKALFLLDEPQEWTILI